MRYSYWHGPRAAAGVSDSVSPVPRAARGVRIACVRARIAHRGATDGVGSGLSIRSRALYRSTYLPRPALWRWYAYCTGAPV